jgi:tetratricopeptide (TPR) repeat protein
MKACPPLVFACLLALFGCSHDAKRDDKSAAPVAALASDSKQLALAPTKEDAAVDHAILAAEVAAKRNPQKLDLWVALGRAWVRKAREMEDPGYYLHADACVDVALEVAPEDSTALDLRALVLLNQHKFAEAEKIARRIVEKRPDDPVAYGTLSDALLELGRTDEAALAAQTMVDLKPNLPSYARAAHFRWLAGDVAGAKAFYRHAIDAGADQRDPEPRAWVLAATASVFWNEGDDSGADAGFDLALDAMHEYAPALAGKARVALARGDAHRAVELAERAYKASAHAEIAWLLGDARSVAGDEEGAKRAYALVVKDGKRGDARTLSLFWSTRGEHAPEALALAQSEQAVRGDATTYDVLAWALFRSGRLAEARVASDRATARGTHDARALYHAGAIRIAQGDIQAGRDLVRRALALQPHFDVTGGREAAKTVDADAQALR